VIGDGAGVGEAGASVVVVDADVGEVVDADWICTSSMAVMTKSLELVVQVIWLIVNVRPTAVAMESGKMTISHA
jgi:Holliday junction resolvasome RuvABC endonuclease subunit